MAKKLALVLSVICSILLFFAVGFGLCTLFRPLEEIDYSNSFHWIPDESYYAGYDIVDDRVIFRYCICYANNGQDDIEIKISAKFSAGELKGWIQDDGFFEGRDEAGEWDYRTIKSGEKVWETYWFEGIYLGGTVNTDLSFPEDLLVVQKSVPAS